MKAPGTQVTNEQLAAFHDERGRWFVRKHPNWSTGTRLLQIGRDTVVYRTAEGSHAASLDLEEMSIRAGIHAAMMAHLRRK